MSEPVFDWCGDALTWWGARTADRIALKDPDHSLTYAELDRAVDATVARFRAAGATAGDRVVVICENSAAACIALTAAQRMRAWAAPVNARMTAPEIGKILDHCAPRLVVVTGHVSAEAAAHAERLGAVDEMGWGARMAVWPGAGEPEEVSDDPAEQVAALMYTTGTTGPPKGVMLTHANLCEVARRIGELRPPEPDEHVYCALPISHIFGLGAVLGTALGHGYSVDFVPRFDPRAVLRAFAEDGVTTFSGVPAMHAALVAVGEAEGVHAPRLRHLTSGGAPLDPGLKARVETLFGLPLGNGYGLTETAPLGAATPPGIFQQGTSVGPAFPGVELSITDAEGQPLPPGEVGEIRFRGRCIMKGYYKAPELSAEVLTPDGWFRTGDLGHVDARGWLHVSGRLKELIIRSGFNVYPPEIEGVLTKEPTVALAAVVGRRVDGNEVPVAFLQPRPGAEIDLDAVRARVEAELSPYKRPAEYHVLAALPAAATGKILKHKLLELLES